jgi:hypothetical protein
MRSGRDVNEIISPSVEEYLNRNQKAIAILDKLKLKPGVRIVDPWMILCAEGKCRATVDGIPLYRDDDHLSHFGSEVITPVLEPIFKEIK